MDLIRLFREKIRVLKVTEFILVLELESSASSGSPSARHDHLAAVIRLKVAG